MSSNKRVQQIIIRKGHPSFPGCAYLTQLSRRIKNATNYLIKHRTQENGKPISHSTADKILKTEYSDLYTKVPAAMAQRATQIVGEEWNNFYKSLSAWKKNPDKFQERPRPPRYSYKATTAYIGRNGFKLDKGILHLAGKSIEPIQTSFDFSQPYNEKADKKILDEVRIVPKGSCFIIEIIYDLDKVNSEKINNSVLLDSSRKIGIDLGINNLLTIASNQQHLKPVLINGKHIKSINCWYNKRAANLRSSNNYNHLSAVGFKRHRRIKDALHRASKYVLTYCLDNDIGEVVIGHNKGWKQEVNLGKVNNQKFVSIPHSVLIDQIVYKCERVGINVIVREESYTSKASYLDRDPMPSSPVKGSKPEFSGKRIKRGLYKAKSGLLNADVNGALNILRKETGDAFGLACRGVVFTPTSLTLGASPRRRDVRRSPSKHLALAA